MAYVDAPGWASKDSETSWWQSGQVLSYVLYGRLRKGGGCTWLAKPSRSRRRRSAACGETSRFPPTRHLAGLGAGPRGAAGRLGHAALRLGQGLERRDGGGEQVVGAPIHSVDHDCNKRIPGLPDGANENAIVALGLLESLVERDLGSGSAHLFVLDSLNALHRPLLRSACLLQPCRNQKTRNLIGPLHPRSSTTRSDRCCGPPRRWMP